MEIHTRKIAIIGAGHVGSHAGYALLSQGLAEEIVYIDIDEKKAEAQALDLYDSTVYLPKRALVYAGDYSDIKDAQLLIVAAGHFYYFLCRIKTVEEQENMELENECE